MFNFFKKKANEKTADFNYGSLMVDMHSHVLPGIDDGAQNVEESIFLIKKMMELGITKIIATPHIMVDFYRNTPETIFGALDLLKAELEKQQLAIEIQAAAEHYFDETFEKRVDEKKLLTMGDNYALFEYSFVSAPPNAVNVIKKMLDGGYKPILAHPERYNFLDINTMAGLRKMGCNLQLNTISLTGYYGNTAKKKAEDMVDKGLVDFISSDMHHPKHAEALADALNTSYVEKLLFELPLKNSTLI